MPKIRVMWISAEQGGRRRPLPLGFAGAYFPVARFPDDPVGKPGNWSVQIDIARQVVEDGVLVGYGDCRFLVADAPHHKLDDFPSFEIYEGPRKVGVVSRVQEEAASVEAGTV